jgi:hypothetical protein
VVLMPGVSWLLPFCKGFVYHFGGLYSAAHYHQPSSPVGFITTSAIVSQNYEGGADGN